MYRLLTTVVFILAATDIALLMVHEFNEHQTLPYFTLLAGLIFLLLVCGVAYCNYTNQRLRQAQEQLGACREASEESRRALNLLIDNIPCAVATITPQYIVQDINNELARLTGVKREEACGKKCYDVFGFGEICPGCPVRGAQLTGTVCRNVKRGINRKDREIWIEQTAIPLLDSDDTVRQVVEIIYDITAVLLTSTKR